VLPADPEFKRCFRSRFPAGDKTWAGLNSTASANGNDCDGKALKFVGGYVVAREQEQAGTTQSNSLRINRATRNLMKPKGRTPCAGIFVLHGDVGQGAVAVRWRQVVTL
jgi:hypothetical protein